VWSFAVGKAGWAYLGLLLVGLISHGHNMFGYPLYLGDEGIYMAQAYAVAHLGRITPPPYAYFYDHAPIGWVQIALWTMITGGFYTFGQAIDSGRVLALLLHLGSLTLVWAIVRQLTRNTWSATIAGLIYTLSPLAIWYGRQILLDNLMMVWLLLAIWLFIGPKPTARQFCLSGLCFGLAVLTKVTAIVLLPAFLYGLWRWSAIVDRSSSELSGRDRGIWCSTAIGTLLSYPLWALLRGELLKWPLTLSWQANSGTLLGGILWQAQRRGGAAWDPNSAFWRMWTQEWWTQDAWLLGLGGLAAIVGLIWGGDKARFGSLISGCLLGGLARGGPVLDFYAVALLPLLAINLGLAMDWASQGLPNRKKSMLLGFCLVMTIAIGQRNLATHAYLFNYQATSVQRQALAWVRTHVAPQALIVTDDDLFTDLRYPPIGLPAFPHTHSHWKLQGFGSYARSVLGDDWRKVDYLLVSPGGDKVYALEPEGVPSLAYRHSRVVAHFQAGSNVFDVRQVEPGG
jgi:4-amino-4-deoxy-L-arabinose transferase-like glycosyltransferase